MHKTVDGIEERMAGIEQPLAAAFGSMGYAVVIADCQRGVNFMNAAAQALTGWSAEEALGHAIDEIVRLRNEETGTVLLRQNGEAVPVEHSEAPIRENGQDTGKVVVLRDIAAQRKVQDQLRQASKLEAVGQLAGGVAHEFNNLLSVILGYCGLLLLDSGTRSDRCEQLSAISAAARRASELTRNLLAFGRKEAMPPQPFDLNAVIITAIPELRRVIGERVILKTNLWAANAAMMGDKTEVEQLLINLAANARDAMPAGGTLTISTVDKHSTVLLQVSDTGTGMSAQVADHIFEPFFTTKEVGKGVGLGLAAVYGIVTRSGGHIDVESEPGCGTRFSITFRQCS